MGDKGWFAVDRGGLRQLIHLSSGYHEALCDLGAKLVALALERPEVLR